MCSSLLSSHFPNGFQVVTLSLILTVFTQSLQMIIKGSAWYLRYQCGIFILEWNKWRTTEVKRFIQSLLLISGKSKTRTHGPLTRRLFPGWCTALKERGRDRDRKRGGGGGRENGHPGDGYIRVYCPILETFSK